jgi:glucose-6-phosphate dehydrogenase assembly protein OpcA
MADQVIYDSLGWPDAVRSVVATANWVMSERSRQVVSDLAWRRLKPWRRLIGQSLDPAVMPGALESVSEVVVEHGPHALPQAWLLIGWLACRLGWRPAGGKVAPSVEVTWGFQSPYGPLHVTIRRLSEGEPEVRSTSITWNTGGRPVTIRFAVIGPGRLGVTTEGSPAPHRVLAAPQQPRASLVARQLPDLGRDTLFRDTLGVARTMAEALLR